MSEPAIPAPPHTATVRRVLSIAALVAAATAAHSLGFWFAARATDAGPAVLGDLLLWTLRSGLTQFCGVCAMLAIVNARLPRLPATGWRRTRGLLSLVPLCALGGWITTGAVLLLTGARDTVDWPGLAWSWMWSLSLASLLVLAEAWGQRNRQAQAQLHDAELRRVSLARELDAARLQLLQAQVEPHFLFNALANVRRLLRTEPADAHALLGDLLRYLQEALPALRDERTTLGREIELVRAFLAVHQVRMGARLQAELHVPAELAGCTVPPMVLLTLVENALKHGLQPLVDGGSVRVAACRADDRLVLTVADTGRGMGSSSGGGTGLANVRARLKQMYGNRASLALALNEPQGVVATVSLPLREQAA